MDKKKKNEITIRSSAAEYLTFIAASGDNQESFEVRYEDENIWITQKMMATLYNVEVPTISYHIKKVFENSELQQGATIRKFLTVQNEGNRQVSREVDHYNLQMIIAGTRGTVLEHGGRFYDLQAISSIMARHDPTPE